MMQQMAGVGSATIMSCTNILVALKSSACHMPTSVLLHTLPRLASLRQFREIVCSFYLWKTGAFNVFLRLRHSSWATSVVALGIFLDSEVLVKPDATSFRLPYDLELLLYRSISLLNVTVSDKLVDF